MKTSPMGTGAVRPSQAHRGLSLTWYAYLDRLFIAFGIGCLVGGGLMLLF